MRENAPETTDDLIELLDRFNRKERYFLICNALGVEKFCLDDKFRKKLGTEIGIDIPPNAGVWMDYHLDWLAASLASYRRKSVHGTFPNPVNGKVITGSQQDIDLLIAFKKEETHHLVLLEAKGYSYWNNNQAKQKVERLTRIFGHEGTTHHNVEPHLCLTSPRLPRRLDVEKWPEWMKNYRWMELETPRDRLTVTRIGPSGTPPTLREHFSIQEI